MWLIQSFSIAYYNEARILDPVTFNTVVTLPNAPQAVNDCGFKLSRPLTCTHICMAVTGGRTYPLEGAAVIFPMQAPYTDPMRIMLCGGSTIGVATALDNCVSIEPEVENPTWSLERMVGPR